MSQLDSKSGAESGAPGSIPRRNSRSGVVVPHRPTWIQRLGAWIVFVALRALAVTLRYSWKEQAGILTHPPSTPVIFCLWHNRLALCMEARRVFNRRTPGRGIAALVSASKDGGFLAGILERFKVQPVRGSSSRRGPQALLELTKWAQRGYDLAITPDGPRGPCYGVQHGVMSLAQVTGLPIIPFSYNARWKIRLKSWDRFQIPLPFSRCEMVTAEPILVPRDLSDEQREQLRLRLERTLNEISQD
jgi:lysophospholipid acyltransferase (LPLAT)-like uncharacterized protein